MVSRFRQIALRAAANPLSWIAVILGTMILFIVRYEHPVTFLVSGTYGIHL
jgi:hypothetical protein